MIRIAIIVTLVCTGCPSPKPSPEETFRDSVVPILESHCASTVCHGAAPSVSDEHLEGAFAIRVDDNGRIHDWRGAYDVSRRFINTVDGPDFSSLVRKPLPVAFGGTGHRGGDNVTSTSDPVYRTLRDWIALEPSGGEDPNPAQLSSAERHFADNVQPVLMGRSCGLTNCHGPTAFIPFRLDPGIPSADGSTRFSVGMTRANYLASRRFLTLDGDPAHSRLLRKTIPIDQGGIAHRGGNVQLILGPDDPAFETLLEFAEREQADHWGGTPTIAPTGLVFARGPIGPSNPFNIERFQTGTELFLRVPAGPEGEETNLTAAHHGGEADIRDPAVSPEGTHLLFALRDGEDAGHQLVELDIEEGTVRALTDDPPRLPSGAALANVMPVYGPDGYVYFASNRHDTPAERGDALDIDLYRIPREGGEAERLTFTPAPELEPAIFRVAPLENYLVFEYRRAIDTRDRTVGFSFPLDRHVDYHIYFGITSQATRFHQFRELPDGRSTAVVSGSDSVWEGGQLVLIDRNLGPDLPFSTTFEESAVVNYRPSLRPIDPNVALDGVSDGGIYRDPVPMPDGSLLVSWARGPIDLSDPNAEPDFAVVRIVYNEESAQCSGSICLPEVTDREIWVDSEGQADYSPELVRRRPGEASPDSAIDPDGPSLFSMVDIAVNDGVMAGLPPSGLKRFRDDVRYVRLVEPVPPDAASATLSMRVPSRILAELPLHDDHSLYLDVPPEQPFRTQLLDDQRMNIGVQHNRWLFVWPGQHFSQSTHRDLYDARCGGCHGSESGAPEETLVPVDVITQATITLARFDDRDPRSPRDPEVVGETTRLTVDYQSDIQPLLTAHCTDCHGQDGDLPNLSGSDVAGFPAGYRSLLEGGWGDDEGGNARTSPIMALVTGEPLDTDADWSWHESVSMSEEDRLMWVRWIEVGLPYIAR